MNGCPEIQDYPPIPMGHTSTGVLAEGYRLVEGPPTASEYVALREQSGLGPKTCQQAEVAIEGGWASVRVLSVDGVVGMGRIIGDGGWYFHIIDMAVLPAHQRRGLGDALLMWLVERITADAPAGPYTSLLADEPGRRLYERHGFVPTAPGSIDMRSGTASAWRRHAEE